MKPADDSPGTVPRSVSVGSGLAEELDRPPDVSGAEPDLSKRRAWLLITAGCAVPLAAAVVRFSGHATDDIFITYRYAANFAAGRGLVFNPGERVFGVSDPLQAVLLGTVHRLSGIDIPLLGTIVTALAMLVTIAALCRAALTVRSPLHAAVGVVFLSCSVFPWISQGAGPLPGLALLLLGAEVARRRLGLAGVLAGLAILFRPDMAIGAALLGLLLFLDRRTAGAAAAAAGRFVAAALTVAGLGWSCFALYFGRLLPGTLTAKHQFAVRAGEAFDRVSFWREAAALWSFAHGQLAWLLAFLGLIGLAALFRTGSLTLRFLALFSVCSALFYTAIGVPFFAWYSFATAVGLLFGAGFLLADFLVPGRPTGWPLRIAAGATLAGLLATLLAASSLWWSTSLFPDWRRWSYRAAGEWIRDHSRPEQTIAAEEVGQLGYWSDRPLDDLVGLVTPDSLRFRVKQGSLGAFLARPADFVLRVTDHDQGFGASLPHRPWFPRAYREAVRLHDPARQLEVVVYRLADRSQVPPPRPPGAS